MSGEHTKFYLDKQNAKWAGVCAGIADYIGINAIWVRLGAIALTFMIGPWFTLPAYFVAAWVASPKPLHLYGDAQEQKFWQGVRQSPSRTARDVKAQYREIDRRLADLEAFYTGRNRELEREIESLR